MKKMIVFILGMFLLAGCGEKKYSLGYGGTFIPDSNKVKYTEYVQKTTEESKIYDSLLNVRTKNFNRAIR